MLKIYEIPSPEVPSSAYDIKINGQSAQAYKARVSKIPFNQVWPGHQRPIDHTELSSFVSFDTDETVTLEITPNREFSEVVVRPLSKSITPTRCGNTLTFSVNPGDILSLELDGFHENLHIFANHIVSLPSADDDNVIYFGAGTHDVGQMFLRDNQTVVIDSGAVVYGSIMIKDVKNVRVCGHGILCNSTTTRMGLSFPLSFLDNEDMVLPDEYQAIEEHPDAKKVELTGCMKIISSENVSIEGITFRDSSEWTATVGNSVGVTFDNVKLLGMWRYNADGIDYCNSKNGGIKNSFLRNFDDNIVVKGLKPYDKGMFTEELHFEKNVIWCDWGRCLEIGAETCSDEMRNVVFRDIDVIHGIFAHMDVQNGDRGHVHDILFEDIRLEYSKHEPEPIYQWGDDAEYQPTKPYHMPDIFATNIMHCMWSEDDKRGLISDITLRNISVTTDDDQPMPKIVLVGLDAEHTTNNITIENLTVNGKHITSDELIDKNEFVTDIVVK